MWTVGQHYPQIEVLEDNVNEATGLKFSSFFLSKDGLVSPTLQEVSSLWVSGKPVSYIRCDNGDKNILLKSVNDSAM